MKALLGHKIGMTQLFDESGRMVPVTLVQAGPCVVTQVRTTEKDGYNALQLGFGNAKKITRPLVGHLKKSKATSRVFREVRFEPPKDNDETEHKLPQVGELIDVSVFEPGDLVKVTGTSKGKGFAGTIKRHNFHRGPKTHGGMSYRRPGSIGSMYPQKIFKGKRMAGHMGHEQVTVSNLKIVEIIPEDNVIAIEGALPGPNRSVVFMRGI